jgi:hypothetical protein
MISKASLRLAFAIASIPLDGVEISNAAIRLLLPIASADQP